MDLTISFRASFADFVPIIKSTMASAMLTRRYGVVPQPESSVESSIIVSVTRFVVLL